MELDPSFPSRPYVYVLYTYDHVLGDPSRAPKWGTHPADQEPPTSDPCPTPPGPMTDGCVVSGRLSRLQAAGNAMTGSEKVLIEDWCQQFPSHSIGTVAFGPDGAVYASGGDGASFAYADYGQSGSPANPCGDPPGTVGSVLTPPTAEGGSPEPRLAHERRSRRPERDDHPRRSGERSRLADQSARRQPRLERPADHRLRTSEPVPVRVPARHE